MLKLKPFTDDITNETKMVELFYNIRGLVIGMARATSAVATTAVTKYYWFPPPPSKNFGRN